MSERTAPSLAAIDLLLPALKNLPDGPERGMLVDETDALRRAVAAFHMEAIRSRMYKVDRLLASQPETSEVRRLFGELRHALESAGFHTRSHTAP